MTVDPPIVLRHGATTVHVHAGVGGRIGQIDTGSRTLLTSDAAAGPVHWGSYPMVPWAGRVGNGTFVWQGEQVRLQRNDPPHALHGIGLLRAWQVTARAADTVELSLALDWPLGGQTRQRIVAGDRRVRCEIEVVADQPMPVVVGWHPWFRKPDAASLRFGAMYERGRDHLPTGAMVTPPPDPPWDDCFVDPLAPMQLHYRDPDSGGFDTVVTIDSSCDHWVVYDMTEHSTCVEPQSAPPDAFNIGGATVLQPGERLQHWMTISWRTGVLSPPG
jgi:aldose 1-epimerase